MFSNTPSSPGSYPPPPSSDSPPWGSTIKLIVGLTVAALFVALFIQFRGIIGPLILAFILAYLIHPVIQWFTLNFSLPWRTGVNLIYLVMIVLILGSFTFAGVFVVNQIQNLVAAVGTFVERLPEIVADLSTQVYQIGPFVLDLSQLELTQLTNQALGAIQPMLSQVGTIVTTFATSAATTIGWTLFILLLSYFLLAESTQFSSTVVHIDLPGYKADVRKLGFELKRIWDAFLRGQITIIFLVIVAYSILMMVWGVRYSLALAILAGLARFVPYAGPLISNLVTALVAFFQDGNHFDIEPFVYMILVIGSSLVLDQIFDNIISPRFMGHALGVHPAGVLVAAIVATQLIGIVGLVLAAPVLATLQLFARYIFRKMFDLPPWPPTPPEEVKPKGLLVRGANRMKAWVRLLRKGN